MKMSASDSTPKYRYNARLASQIEAKWQDRWESQRTFEAPNPAGPLAEPAKIAGRKKLFILDMFPYPSGAGLHVGHPLGYIATDVFGRFKRMNGFNVLHALGYDSFGLPAEQHAITTGVHPRENTESNISNMRRQLRRLGLAHDARRSVSTTDEAFYRWTQWIFLQVFNSWFDAERGKARPIGDLIAEFASGKRDTGGKAWKDMSSRERKQLVNDHRLAYLADAPVNWCPGLGTILANEEVTAEGRSDIGNYPVFKRNMRQWTMRITAYADRLLDDLERLDWPESIKLMQRNWIGRSEGARVRFASGAGDIEVFTTRPDTLFGATFMVLSPEHPLVDSLTTPAQRTAVEAYRAQAASAAEADRQSDTREKTGVFVGAYAVNPVTGKEVPVWIADYVLMGYGTGAIMAVPSGDERDFAFARKYGLPVVATQMPPDSWFAAHGIAPSADCSSWPDAFVGEGTYINSRNDSLVLDGINEMSAAKKRTNEWLEARGAGRAAITYKLRDWLFSRQRYWMGPQHDGHTGGVDLYVGGVEHAVLHLLYSRFWHKVLYDLGHVSSEEPFHRLFNQGYIQAYAYRDARGQAVPAAEVLERDGKYFYEGEQVSREYGKMGKSLKNIVTPDEMYDEFGADTFRLYEMSMGPLEASRPWNTRDVVGMQRFLQRVWRNLVDEETGAVKVADAVAPDELRRLLHRTIEGVRADMDNLRFNTAIAKLIELNNALTQEVARSGATPRELADALVQMLSPLCPHLGEELWERLGHEGSITYRPFPSFDASLLTDDTIEYPVQVNGKVRSRIVVSPDADQDTVKAIALAD
ncbi:MAG: leucine--tRNA ligase, partial [Actinobacteria bacterium]|nr:leucine--tRNA ligase [Actinomycetota bacterium]